MSELPACLRAIDELSKLPPLSADAHGGHGSGLRAKCPLHVDTDGHSPYIEYMTNECMDPDCGENELLDMSGLYYSFDVDPPPGPLSELFTFFVRVYLRPVDADGDGNRWARFIDLDAPMPPLRPYAISISLRPAQEMNDGLTQESYAYFLDNMIFK